MTYTNGTPRNLPRLSVAIVVATLFAVPITAVEAAIVTELGDSGDLPGSAQVLVGSGIVERIQGNLVDFGNFVDVDMFGIYIPDLSLFSASTVSSNTLLVDTQLFLFDQSGYGVIANDDAGILEFNATIPVGSAAGGPGLYYLAVAQFAEKPISASGLIFPDMFTTPPAFPDEIVGPTGPGGAAAIIGWNTDAYSDPKSAYEIILNGAEFAPVPEPSSLLVFGSLTAIALACFRRRVGAHSRYFTDSLS